MRHLIVNKNERPAFKPELLQHKVNLTCFVFVDKPMCRENYSVQRALCVLLQKELFVTCFVDVALLVKVLITNTVRSS